MKANSRNDTHLVRLFPFLFHHLQPQDRLDPRPTDPMLCTKHRNVPSLTLPSGFRSATSEWRSRDRRSNLVREKVFLVDHFFQRVRERRRWTECRVRRVGLCTHKGLVRVGQENRAGDKLTTCPPSQFGPFVGESLYCRPTERSQAS